MANLAVATAKLAEKAIFTPSATYYLSVHTATPGQTGLHEAAVTRKPITFGTPNSTGVQFSTDAQTITTPTTTSVYPYIGVWTSATGGSFKWGGPSGFGTRVIGEAQILNFPVGSITAEVA